jgi:NitT/TauT family transport system substrate-binding protein
MPQTRNALGVLVALGGILMLLPPALGQPLRIGIGTGLAFLPLYVCEAEKLIEKHGKAVHLDLNVSFPRYYSAGALEEALASGAIDMAPFGVAPLLAAWEKSKGTPQQILALSGLTTLPPVLLTNRENVRTLADFKPADRIAIPARTAPQLYLLQMQSEKLFGEYDKLARQIVVLPHPEATAALLSASEGVSGYFSSSPFAEVALADARVHKILSPVDVIGGKASFLILGATKSYTAAHATAAEAVAQAMDEAARLIHDDPHHAAEIFLVHEPSKTFDVTAMTAIIDDLKDEYGSAVHGVQAFADFMGRHHELKAPPQSWKEIVAPALLKSPST